MTPEPIFAAAHSQHPEPASATAEVLGRLEEGLGGSPDVVVVFLSGDIVSLAPQILAMIEVILDPGLVIGSSCAGVIGPGEVISGGTAISAWAARHLPVVPLTAPSLDPQQSGLAGPDHKLQAGSIAVVLADPFSTPVTSLVEWFNHHCQDVVLVGGLASGPSKSARIFFNSDQIEGAVGFVIPPGLARTHHLSRPTAKAIDLLVATPNRSSLLFHSVAQPLVDANVSAHGSHLLHDKELPGPLAGMLTAGEFGYRDGHNAAHMLSSSILAFEPSS